MRNTTPLRNGVIYSQASKRNRSWLQRRLLLDRNSKWWSSSPSYPRKHPHESTHINIQHDYQFELLYFTTTSLFPVKNQSTIQRSSISLHTHRVSSWSYHNKSKRRNTTVVAFIPIHFTNRYFAIRDWKDTSTSPYTSKHTRNPLNTYKRHPLSKWRTPQQLNRKINYQGISSHSLTKHNPCSSSIDLALGY